MMLNRIGTQVDQIVGISQWISVIGKWLAFICFIVFGAYSFWRISLIHRTDQVEWSVEYLCAAFGAVIASLPFIFLVAFDFIRRKPHV